MSLDKTILDYHTIKESKEKIVILLVISYHPMIEYEEFSPVNSGHYSTTIVSNHVDNPLLSYTDKLRITKLSRILPLQNWFCGSEDAGVRCDRPLRSSE